MRYLGGKARLGCRIVQAILDDLGVKRIGVAVDLCSGAGGVTHRLADVSDRVVAVEAHPGLVALHKAVQGGWVPPETVTEEDYQALRSARNPADPLTAFAEFGCSFGGKSWGGYSHGTKRAAPRGFAYPASRSTVKRMRPNVEHVHGDALTHGIPSNAQVVYNDPPYEGTATYDAVPIAGAGAWWRRLADLASPERACYLSEYAEAPPAGIEARLVWTAPVNGSQLAKAGRVERLWRVLGWTQVHDAHLEREDAA